MCVNLCCNWDSCGTALVGGEFGPAVTVSRTVSFQMMAARTSLDSELSASWKSRKDGRRPGCLDSRDLSGVSVHMVTLE